MESEIMFSIHVPVYNVEDYIGQCVDSILEQTYRNFELILTDDGSTDNSGRICDEYAARDKRVKVFHNSNRGLLMTRRFSVEKTRGKYCAFVDSDDCVEKNWLERVYDVIKRTKSDIVAFNFKYVYANREISAEKVFKEEAVFDKNNIKTFYNSFIRNTNLRCMCAKIIRSELVINDRTDYEKYCYVKIAEDFFQSIYPVFNAEKIVYIPESLYKYRQREGSNIHSVYVNWCRDEFCVRNYALKYMENAGMMDFKMKQYYAAKGLKIAVNTIYSYGYINMEREEFLKKLDALCQDDFFKNYIVPTLDTSKLSVVEKMLFIFLRREQFNIIYSLIKIRSKAAGFVKKVLRAIKMKDITADITK